MTDQNFDFVPGLDPVAAQRWQARRHTVSPWLHEEVGRRMAERLSWLVNKPQDWLVFMPHGSGQAALRAVQAQCQTAQVWWPSAALPPPLRASWWQRGWLAPSNTGPQPLTDHASDAVDMIWANMAMHALARPQTVMAQWLRQLRVQGFVMCSGLGPDSLQELREVYARMGWPAPVHGLTDMHDWGDMLVQTGFAEPVMDMERMTLAYEHPRKLLDDLRAWGRNLSDQRFEACRGRGYVKALEKALVQHLPRNAHGHMTITLEIIYGYAVKPLPRPKVSPHTTLSLQEMRAMLKPKV